MAWTYADWANRQETATAVGVNVAARQLIFSGDLIPVVKRGMRVAYSGDTGGSNGTYTVQEIAYSPDETTLTFEHEPTSAAGDGTLTIPVSSGSKLAYLRQHIAEVSQEITANVATDGTSIGAGALQPYLNELMKTERRLNGNTRGLFRGRVISHASI